MSIRRYLQTRILCGCLVGIIAATPFVARAGQLSPSGWVLRDAAGASFVEATDNNIASGALLTSTQGTVRCVVDLGSVATVHRVCLTAADRPLNPSSTDALLNATNKYAVTVRVGDTMSALSPVLGSLDTKSVTGREIRVQANLRFQPTTGRYLVIDLNRGALANRWNLGEVEVFGWSGDWRAHREDAVVVATNAPAPLKLAAQELSYYLGELAGRPIPMIASNQASLYPGTIYRIVDLKPLATTYEQMTNNMALGLFPSTPVNVERNGREVVFRAWPYRNVLWSVWEFLDRQGVKWVYPDAHGDHVPTGQGIDLSFAPLQYTPSTDFIYANFGVEYLRDDPDAFLHFWRNRWSHTWGGHQRDTYGGSEVPLRPFPNQNPSTNHVEGFYGYPHNFANVIPERILQQNPTWCGMITNQRYADWIGAANLNKRLLPSVNHSTFDLTNPDARQFVINKAIDCWNSHAKYQGPIYWMLPEDSTLFSEDAASMAMRQPYQDDHEPFAMPYHYSVSADYYDFVCAIANGVRNALPEAKIGAMAYSNTHLPPDRAPFPTNVLVDICMYGVRNLPMSSPKNAEMRTRLEQWAALVPERRHYDYDLIHSEFGALKMPVPLVGAMSDRARVYDQLGMLKGGTQADLDSLPYNPWNYYAYPRFHWDVSMDPAAVINEFFIGYFREAATPMRDYYLTIERFLTANNVSLQARGYDYGLRVGAYPISVLKRMNQLLVRAESQAASWVTRQRVAKMREGFEWILQQRGLTVADLAATTWMQHVGPGTSTVIDMRTASIQTAGQDVGDAWFLFSWAEVGDYVYFEKAGRYEVSIRAGMGYPDSTPRRREMMFRIGALEYGPFLIDHESIDTYRLIVEVPAGIFEVTCEDMNNDGPFEVSTITIVGPSIAPPAPQARGPLTHVYDYSGELNPADGVDSDWDGTPDFEESVAGTDELDPESFFAVRSVAPADGGLAVSWPSADGRVYSLYRTTSLGGSYELVADHISATPPENTFIDASSSGSAFYFIRVR